MTRGQERVRRGRRRRQENNSSSVLFPSFVGGMKESTQLLLDGYEHRLATGQKIDESSLEAVRQELSLMPAFEGSLDIMLQLLDIQDRAKRGKHTKRSTSTRPVVPGSSSYSHSKRTTRTERQRPHVSSSRSQGNSRSGGSTSRVRRINLLPIREDTNTSISGQEDRGGTSSAISDPQNPAGTSTVVPEAPARSVPLPSRNNQSTLINDEFGLVVIDSMNHQSQSGLQVESTIPIAFAVPVPENAPSVVPVRRTITRRRSRRSRLISI